MKAKSINLSAGLTEALKAQAPYSKRGRSLAQNAISMIDTTVSNVSYQVVIEAMLKNMLSTAWNAHFILFEFGEDD